MDVVRHDYITANGDVEVTLRTLGISDKGRVNFIAREIRLPQVSAKDDKIERARIKQTIETRRAASEILLHVKTCSHGPMGRPIKRAIPGIDRPQVRTPDGFVLWRTGGYNIRETGSEIE